MLEANDNNKNDEATIKMFDNGCRIQLRESEKLMGLQEERKSKLHIEFNNLCYSVYHNGKGVKKTILRDVTGQFEPGKVTVIIGPSGAGKTTLMKIISGEGWSNVDGTVTINGIEQKKGIFRRQMCYVPQQFALLPFLTTKETLHIAARLKLNIKHNKQAIVRCVVNEIAESLGLLSCLDILAEKLSGGERKRLSIGVEMITKPSIFLLDEPTSGLDSVSSNQLINVLHNMARKDCTVVCAIHQPSSQMISQFDDIMVLDRGRCMYCGPKNEILNVYECAGYTCPSFYNIAEFVLEVITEQRGGDLENLYKICHSEYEKLRDKRLKNEADLSATSKQNLEQDNVLTSANNTKQTLSTWQQQRVLFSRAFICIGRDKILTMLRFAAHFVVALLLGAVFYDFGNDARKVYSNIAGLFFFLMFLFYANAIPAVQMFPTEASVFLQEHLNNWYSFRSYYSVKILTDLPMQILCASTFILISYYITGQPMEPDRVLKAWSIGVLITILGQTFGIMTGAAFNTELGIFLIPASSIPMLLFSGFFLKVEEMSVYLQSLSFVSFFRYAFEGLIQTVYDSDRPNLYCSEVYCSLHSPSAILSVMGMPTMSFYTIVSILASWIIGLHIIIYGILCWKIYYARK